MKKISVLLIVGIFVAAAMPQPCRAVDLTQEEVTPGAKKIYLEPQRSPFETGKFNYLLAATLGYDNNANLNSDRTGDTFAQTFFRTNWSTAVSKKTSASADYEFMYLKYADEDRLDLTRNSLHGGIDHRLSKTLIGAVGYTLDVVEYTNQGADDFVENSLGFKLRQSMGEKMFHSLFYYPSYRMYGKRYIRSTEGVYNPEKKRNDLRNTLEYEIARFFPKDFLKVTFQYYNNNSNEPYLKYYDFDSSRIGANLTHLFDKKLSCYLSASYQLRDYRSRTLAGDPGSKQEDKTTLMTAALFYALTKSMTVGLSYSYRQNDSNEPLERYSGSLVSVSTYYRF